MQYNAACSHTVILWRSACPLRWYDHLFVWRSHFSLISLLSLASLFYSFIVVVFLAAHRLHCKCILFLPSPSTSLSFSSPIVGLFNIDLWLLLSYLLSFNFIIVFLCITPFCFVFRWKGINRETQSWHVPFVLFSHFHFTIMPVYVIAVDCLFWFFKY